MVRLLLDIVNPGYYFSALNILPSLQNDRSNYNVTLTRVYICLPVKTLLPICQGISIGENEENGHICYVFLGQGSNKYYLTLTITSITGFNVTSIYEKRNQWEEKNNECCVQII